MRVCTLLQLPRPPEILPEAFDLVHAFVQNGDDTDVAVAKPLPIDRVFLVADEIALHAEGGGNRARDHPVRADSLKGFNSPVT